jgi:hypothetical protein
LRTGARACRFFDRGVALSVSITLGARIEWPGILDLLAPTEKLADLQPGIFGNRDNKRLDRSVLV